MPSKKGMTETEVWTQNRANISRLMNDLDRMGFEDIGRAVIGSIAEEYETLERVLTLSDSELMRVRGVGKTVIKRIRDVCNGPEFINTIRNLKAQGKLKTDVSDAFLDKLTQDAKIYPPEIVTWSNMTPEQRRLVMCKIAGSELRL